MNVQANCPRCKHEKFAVIEHVLYNFRNANDGNREYSRIINLLCCDSCGAVICQFDWKDHEKDKLI